MTGNEMEESTVVEIVDAIDFTAETPEALFKQIYTCLLLLGRDVTINFESGHHGLSVATALQGDASPVPMPLSEALYKLTAPLLRCEIDGWHEHNQASGRMMFSRNDGVWLDCEDIDADWDYQRFIDLDVLAGMEFREPEEDTPSLLSIA